MTLTKRQKELLDFLQSFIRDQGYAPTLEEIGAHFELSSLATVHKHLSNLEDKGLIRRRWNHSRALEIIPQEVTGIALELPLLGLVAAGEPIEAIETPETISIPENLVRKHKNFVLRVKGESMIEDGILDGDFIVTEERDTADNGDMVVAVINGHATLKRFFRELSGQVRLQPANARMTPIYVSNNDLSIRGVVVAVIRKYR